MGTASDRFAINVGPLTSVSSLASRVGDRLQEFGRLYRSGVLPEVEWDLREVVSGRMNMAALTSLLALIDRMYRFLQRPQTAHLKYDPDVFAFWNDISFVELAEKCGGIQWNPDVVRSCRRGGTNPNTKLFVVPLMHRAPDKADLEQWKNWKDALRREVKDRLLLRCGPLLESDQPGQIREVLSLAAIAAAELVVNALLWGRATAFVGLQRSGAGITISVCDAGSGLLTSLTEKRSTAEGEHLPLFKTDVDAILVASLMNVRAYGLRRAITSVVENGGWVLVSSGTSEVQWRERSWVRAIDLAQTVGGKLREFPDSWNILEKRLRGTPASHYPEGYYYKADGSLRGSRISFEIPIIGKAKRGRRML